MKKIGLIDVDSKIPNLALMKLSSYHKKKGDNVEWYSPSFTNLKKKQKDIVYVSKIFTDTSDYEYEINAKEVIKGGIGYDLKNKLPDEIEYIFPDYTIYPDSDYAIGYTTRGCIRNCPFCVVRQKEGILKPVADIYDFWNNQKKIMLLDNNLTAHDEHFEKILLQLIENKIYTDFSQGLDIRLITPEKARLLSGVKLYKQIHFAFDFIEYEDQVVKGIKILEENGVSLSKLMFYVLIGYNTTEEQDLYRINLLKKLKVSQYVMPFDRNNYYQKHFVKWINLKQPYFYFTWEQYKKKVKYDKYNI